jgi:hypothetical protein
MSLKRNTQTPHAVTGQSKLAADTSTTGFREIAWAMAFTTLCRRSINNQLKAGMPHVKLGRRILFHPPSVEAWLLRQQRGGEQ